MLKKMGSTGTKKLFHVVLKTYYSENPIFSSLRNFEILIVSKVCHSTLE